MNYQSIKKILKEYQKLSLLLISITGKKWIFHQIEKTGMSLKKKIIIIIALNILYVPHNTEKIRHAYKSMYIVNRENQVTLLMISDGKKQHYLVVKSLSALFCKVTSNHKE